MPTRLIAIAQKLGIDVRQVIAKGKELGMAATRVPNSSLDDETAARLEEALRNEPGPEIVQAQIKEMIRSGKRVTVSFY
jgi:hypothetical protein